MKSNKQIYESIMKDVSKIVKKHLNENIEESITPYLDDNGLIDLSSLENNELPDFIIKNLLITLLKNGTYEFEPEDDFTVSSFIIVDTENNIYEKSLHEYGVLLEFNANYNIDYTEGMESSDYDVPDDPDEYDITLNNIYNIRLSYGAQDGLEIKSKELIELIKTYYIANDDEIKQYLEENAIDKGIFIS